MAWADCYEHMGAKAEQDRSRQILERGLAVPGVKPRRMLAARLAGDPADDIDFDDFDEETEDGFDYRETIDITPGGARLKKTVTFRRPRPTARQVARPRPVLPPVLGYSKHGSDLNARVTATPQGHTTGPQP